VKPYLQKTKEEILMEEGTPPGDYRPQSEDGASSAAAGKK
jgi:hypothetical protein